MLAKQQEISLAEAVKFVVDNRGRTAPVEESGIPLIATNCISNQNLYPVYERLRYVSDETYKNWFRSHPVPGDIILTNKGSQNGAVCLVPNPVDFCIAQDMVALRADDKKIDPLYLFSALRSDLVQYRIKNLNVDAVIPHFKKTDFDKLLIPYPSRNNQKFIGQVYHEISRKIELNRQMNATLEAMAQALFKSWFVDFDPVIDNALAAGSPIPDALKARADARLVLGEKRKPLPEVIRQQFPRRFKFDDESGWAPEGWSNAPISKLADLNSESWAANYSPGEIKYVDLANTKNGKIEMIVPYDFSDAPSRARRVLRENDTIIGTVRPGNRSFSYVHQDGLTGSTGFAVMRPKEDCYRCFVYFCLTRDVVIERFAHLADGAAYPAIRPNVVAQHLCSMPSRGLLEAYDKIVYPWVDCKGIQEASNDSLAKLRDTLLPKLLSGELRIPDAEKLVEKAI